MARRASHEPHAVLGVHRGATRGEIASAYRARARLLHPDVSGSDTTTEMADLSAARDKLLEHAPPDRARRPSGKAGERPPTGAGERPDRTADHEPAWTDHWAAWNEPRRRSP